MHVSNETNDLNSLTAAIPEAIRLVISIEAQ
jgi:hypothetical protein